MHCHQVTAEPLVLSPELQASIESTWQHFNEWRPTEEIARLCRYIEDDQDGIALCSDVTYKDVVGLRFQGAPTPPPFHVLTAIAIVRTPEKELVFLERDSGDWPNSLEFPGGFIRATHLPIDSADFIRARCIRDLSISPDGIDNMRFVEAYDYDSILEHMLIYEVELTVSATEALRNNPRVIIAPPNYTPAAHAQYFDLPLHPPTHTIAERFLNA